ncbi:SusC/RagA family TonB-linked outer membrane protein [Membranihabitans maritimus]|uniref:SusC/RagA family TonB-linked outer membrane protein n=1 Tax=Membranihabitans maritimus TaxID=2904244 RepID=UPI001F0177BE|nr:SusC/RagA family TonB-linked outer membrane protein [Membranihabitans maritimus]
MGLFLQLFKIKTGLIAVLIVFSGIFINAGASNYLQIRSGDDILQRKISLQTENESLNLVLDEISRIANVRIMYTGQVAQADQRVTFDAKNLELGKVLSGVLSNRGFTYVLINNSIVIKKENKFERETSPGRDKNSSDTTGFILEGKVFDRNGEPLIGVNIVLKGTSRGTTSDFNGYFELSEIEIDNILQFSYIGFKSFEYTVKDKGPLEIILESDASQLIEVVVTGHNTVEKSKLTSSVVQVDEAEILENGPVSVDKSLQGRIPGMSVISNSGEPGSIGIVKIRGTSTLTGNAQPLWVVDGVILEEPVPLTPAEINNPDIVNRIGNAIAGINPEDIKSINVLKDASATAIYGVKAAAGVIVITTKRGKKGKPVVNFKTDVGMTLAPSYDRFNMMNSAERIDIEEYYFNSAEKYYNADANINSVGLAGAYARYKNRDLETWSDFENEVRAAQQYNTDWFDVLFRNGVSHNTNINVSGGSDQSTYYVSFSNLGQQGTDLLTNYKRNTALVKLNTKLSSRFDVEFNLSGYTTNRQSYPFSLVPGGISNFTRSTPRPFDYAINTSRTFPAYNEDGSFHFYRGHEDFYLFNVLNEYESSDQTTKVNNLSARITANYRMFDNLKLSGIFSYYKTNTLSETYYLENTNQVAGIRRSEFGVPAPEDSNLPSGGVIFSNSDFQDYYTARLTAEYKPISVKNHQVQLYAGGEFRANSYRGDQSTGWGYLHDRGRIVSPNENIAEELSGAPYLVITDYARKYASYYGVASYTFFEKYTVNGNIRYDGSNLFGSNPKYRWKPAWSVSGRYNLGDEEFMDDIAFLDRIAIRGSYGVQGAINEQSTPQIIASFLPPAYWSELNQLSINQPANPDLRWEKTYNANVGIDFSVARGRVTTALDFYRRKSVDLITNTRISEINGFSYLPINFADVVNNGIELGLTIRNVSTEIFEWSSTINFAYNRNEVTKVNLETNVQRLLSSFPYKPDAAVVGRPLNSLYSVQFAGINDNGVAQFVKDDGEITEQVTGLEFQEEDLVYSGPLEAPYTGGISNFFSYGDFKLSVLLTYGLGNSLRMHDILESWMYAPDQNLSRELLGAWREEGDETYIPHILNQTGSNTHKEFWNMSDIRVIPGDYLRVKNVTLRYDLPDRLLSKLTFENAFLQLEGNNLFLFADERLNGFDPETFVYKSLPNFASFLFGINITF